MSLFLDLLFNGIWTGTIYAILAVTFGMIFRTSRTFHFAHGAVFTVSGFAVYFVQSAGYPLIVGIVLGFIVAGLLGFGIDYLIYRRIRRAGGSTLMLMVSSLGAQLIIVSALEAVFGASNAQIEFDFPGSRVRLGSLIIQPSQLWGFPILVLTGIILWLWYEHSAAGRRARAVASNVALSESLGLPSERVVAMVFLIASAALVFPAVFVGVSSGIYPTMGSTVTLFAVMSTIFGGLQNLRAWAVGGMLFGLVQNVAVLYISTQWQMATAFAVFLIALMIRPEGLSGVKTRYT